MEKDMPYWEPLSDSDIFDPFDLDREEFNPDMCMIRYLQECSLQNMLSRKNHIDNEIRNFSDDFQNLLYDNYEKFINAASVVTNMKNDFQKMEKEVDNLYEKMSDLEKTGSEILKKLRPSEEKISQLLKCQDTMKKLALLTDLAPTLKTYINSGSYSKAAKHYLKAGPVLKKYKNLPSLNGIRKDCAEIVSEIISALRNNFNFEIYGKEELSETLKLLLSLEETPVGTLKYFLKCGDKYLLTSLTSMDERFLKDSEQNNTEQLKNEIINCINLCCSYIERASKIIEIAKEVFLREDDSSVKMCVNKLLEDFFLDNMDRLSNKLHFYIEGKFQNIDDEFLSHNLDKFIRQCHISGIVTPRVNFYLKGMDIALEICVRRCEFLLERMKKDFKDCVLKIKNKFSVNINIQNLLIFLKEWTQQKLIEVLHSVLFYIHPEFKCCREVAFRKMFCKVVVREGIFVAFFRYIIDEILLLQSISEIQQPTELLLCAVLAKYLLTLKQDIVSEFLAKVDANLCSTSENLQRTKAEDVSAELVIAAQKIIEFYIQMRYQNMANMIQKSMENKDWMNSKEPTRPRAVIKMVFNDIQETKAEVKKIFGTYENLGRKGSDFRGTTLFKTYSLEELLETNCIEERVIRNKIFTENSELSEKVEPNTPSIINSLLRKVLKAFVQYVRLKTFNSFSLQQIQIDVCYLQLQIDNLLEFNLTIQPLFDEIMSSAYNRTFKPELMNNKIVSVICSTVFDKI